MPTFNPNAGGGQFDQYKMIKKPGKCLKPWQMGTHLRVLSESFLMNTDMTGFRWFSKNLCILVLWMNVASALEGLIPALRGRPQSAGLCIIPTTCPIAIQFPGHGCKDDLTPERSFDSQSPRVIYVLGLFFVCYPWVFVQSDTGRHLVD